MAVAAVAAAVVAAAEVEVVALFLCCRIIAVLLVWGAVRGGRYVVETYVIKRINPNYVTSFEKVAAEEAKKAAEQARRNAIQAGITTSFSKRRLPDFVIMDYWQTR